MHEHTPRCAILFYTFRGVFLACMQRYTHLAYLFDQCGTCFLSRDGRVADSTETSGHGASYSLIDTETGRLSNDFCSTCSMHFLIPQVWANLRYWSDWWRITLTDSVSQSHTQPEGLGRESKMAGNITSLTWRPSRKRWKLEHFSKTPCTVVRVGEKRKIVWTSCTVVRVGERRKIVGTLCTVVRVGERRSVGTPSTVVRVGERCRIVGTLCTVVRDRHAYFTIFMLFCLRD